MRTTHPVQPEQKANPIKYHLESLTVASCQNSRCGIKRIPLKGSPAMCPNCRHALFYERIKRTQKPHWGKGGMNYDGYY